MQSEYPPVCGRCKEPMIGERGENANLIAEPPVCQFCAKSWPKAEGVVAPPPGFDHPSSLTPVTLGSTRRRTELVHDANFGVADVVGEHTDCPVCDTKLKVGETLKTTKGETLCYTCGRLSQEQLGETIIEGESVYLNQSRLSDFLKCEEFYHLNWEHGGHGLKPKQLNINLEAGSSYHDGIAFYYHHDRDIDGAVKACEDRFDQATAIARPIGDEQRLWAEMRITLAIMVRNYHAKYKDEALAVVAPEVKGAVRLGKSPHYLVFRTDAVFQRYGTIGLLEYKTKGRTPSSLEVARIHSDIQPTAYTYGVRAQTGMVVEGVEFRWAIKKANYDVSRMHLCEWTARTKRDLQRFEDEAVAICERILERRKSGTYVHNWNQCTVFGECAMRRVCLHHRDPATLALYDPRGDDYVVEAQKGGTDVQRPAEA